MKTVQIIQIFTPPRPMWAVYRDGPDLRTHSLPAEMLALTRVVETGKDHLRVEYDEIVPLEYGGVPEGYVPANEHDNYAGLSDRPLPGVE